ncbi:MAG: SDR family oxidoreductase [Deltaproteobacteria bacterium]|nr:SDR family oxidoreductase [Deltaproteobacteria bacterium]
MKIDGSAAIVTGAGSGMGAATAEALARAGAKVALLDFNLEAARTVAHSIGGAAFPCDVADAASAETALAAAREAHGPPRVCVNCAGIAAAKRIVGKSGPMPLEDFARVIQVNLIGTFNVMRLAAAQMRELDPDPETAERGVIVNTASVAAYEGQVGQAAYSASKGGVVSLTLPAARELSTLGIRVLTIAPGLVGTPMMGAMPREVQEGLAAQVPFPKRLGRPGEFASLVLHILDNVLLNGEVIRLDGALRMQP